MIIFTQVTYTNVFIILRNKYIFFSQIQSISINLNQRNVHYYVLISLSQLELQVKLFFKFPFDWIVPNYFILELLNLWLWVNSFSTLLLLPNEIKITKSFNSVLQQVYLICCRGKLQIVCFFRSKETTRKDVRQCKQNAVLWVKFSLTCVT